MRGSRAKSVDLKFGHAAGWELSEELIENERDNDATLAVTDKDNFVNCRIDEYGFDIGVGHTDVVRAIGKRSLNEAFEDICRKAVAVG